MTNNESIQLTGFRLIALLKLLFEKDLSKSELLELLNKKYNLSPSKETIKLDINTLINCGFEIKRGTKTNNYKYSLNKNFISLKLDKKEINFLNSIKNTVTELYNFEDILNLKSLFLKLPFENGEETFELINFKIFNFVNGDIINKLKNAVNKDKSVVILYNSPEKGEIEIEIDLDKITYKKEKLYVEGYSNIHNNYASFRTDKIIKILKFKDGNKKFKKFSKEKTRYIVTKNFYEQNPLEEFEKAVKFGKDKVELEATGIDDFFIVQRILTIGKDCIKIKRKEIKDKIINTLNETLKEYKCL